MYGNISAAIPFSWSTAWEMLKKETRSTLIAFIPSSLQERAIKSLSAERVARIPSHLYLKPNTIHLIVGGSIIVTLAIMGMTHARNRQRDCEIIGDSNPSDMQDTGETQKDSNPKTLSLLSMAAFTIELQGVIYIPPSETAQTKEAISSRDVLIAELQEQLVTLQRENQLAMDTLTTVREEFFPEIEAEMTDLRTQIVTLQTANKALKVEKAALRSARHAATTVFLEQTAAMHRMIANHSARRSLMISKDEPKENTTRSSGTEKPAKRRTSIPSLTTPRGPFHIPLDPMTFDENRVEKRRLSHIGITDITSQSINRSKPAL